MSSCVRVFVCACMHVCRFGDERNAKGIGQRSKFRNVWRTDRRDEEKNQNDSVTTRTTVDKPRVHGAMLKTVLTEPPGTANVFKVRRRF